MKTSFVKKMLVGALAVTMTIGLSLSAFAASKSNLSSASNVSTETVTASASTAAEVVININNNSVGGVKSTLAGIYLADSVKGVAVATSLGEFKTLYGLAANETPFVRTYNFSAKKSFLCQAVFEAVAMSQNAVMGPALNMEFGKISGGKYSILPADGSSFVVKVALKADFFTPGMNYAVICVRPGGAVEVIPATVEAGGVISFAAKAGRASYAVIKY